MRKKLLIFMALLVSSLTAWADANGTCGKSPNESAVTWSFVQSTGTLTISGTGAMADYDNPNDVPWHSHRDVITSVVFGDGVTHIGRNAFSLPGLTSIEIPASVTSIGNGAFNSCSSLTSITCWPTTPPALGTGVFPSGTNIYVPSVNDYKTVDNWSYYYSDWNKQLFPISWEVNTNPIAFGSFAGYWATFYYSGANMQAPEGVTVYKATHSGSSLSLTEISDRIITAGKAVILKKATAGSITLSVAGGASTDGYSGNSLQGVNNATARETASEYKYYTLANGSKGLGFYKYTGATLAANKAYIMTVTSNASEFLFSLDGETTGVNDVRSKKDDVRGDYYNLNGQKVPNPTKGLYIVNGKKVIK